MRVRRLFPLSCSRLPAPPLHASGIAVWMYSSVSESDVSVFRVGVGVAVDDGVDHRSGGVVEDEVSAVVAELDSVSVERDRCRGAGGDGGVDGCAAVVVVGQLPAVEGGGCCGEVGEYEDLVAGVGACGVDQGVGDVDVGVGGGGGSGVADDDAEMKLKGEWAGDSSPDAVHADRPTMPV
jgi:hypothetical protein